MFKAGVQELQEFRSCRMGTKNLLTIDDTDFADYWKVDWTGLRNKSFSAGVEVPPSRICEICVICGLNSSFRF